MKTHIMGIFQYEDDFIAAAKRLSDNGFVDLTMMSPIPMHQIEDILPKKKPVIRRYAFFGALTGAIAGFAMSVATALVFVLPTGGRAIIAVPPYLVISYELTILFGVIFTLVGFHVASGLPAWHDRPYRMESSADRFSILVGCGPEDDVSQVERIFTESGVEEIDRQVSAT